MIEGFGSDFYFGLFVGIVSFLLTFKLLFWIFEDQNGDVEILDEIDEAEDGVRPPVYNPNCCPICLCVQSLALETNCGHLYCGTCLQTHYSITSRGDSSGVSCAMCRQRVVLIFICFNDEEWRGPVDHNNHQTRDDVIRFVRMYNRIVRNNLTVLIVYGTTKIWKHQSIILHPECIFQV
ncbi:E3 ubiquitin-protein ligase RNF170 isoform X2 [Halyomorpha halys]|uniref:E3 ubiquitin-protein ligase RNF170 isoform X2 n=1 Tax=Halyomorpha halys TaxID=286706 RepID=UPI0006D4FF58|nr:E3 ubiquitin-protein ligase RNF170-like isoform X2 [Halyomorpha halys]